jgi:N-acetylmuramoyl-L-alanine amidase
VRWVRLRSLVGLSFLSMLLALVFFTVPVLAGDEGVVKGSIVNVRQGPDLSYSVTAQVKNGEILTVLEKKQGWLKVSTYTGKQGWINNNYLELVLKKVTVTGSLVNTRKGPGTGFQKAGQVKAGKILPVFAEKNGWYRVTVSGADEEWIAGWLVASANSGSLGYVTVNTEVLNIRQGPGTSYALVSKIGLNEQHNVQEQKNGWYKIIVKNIEGWVSGEYVKYVPTKTQSEEGKQSEPESKPQENNQPQESKPQEDKQPQNNTVTGQLPATVIVSGNVVNIRQWNSLEAGVIDQVSSGNVLTVLDAQGDWYHVRLPNGKTGWIAKWLTNSVGEPVPSRSLQKKDVLIVPIAAGKTFKVVDCGGRPELVLEGLSKEQYQIKQDSANKTVLLELQVPSTRKYEGKIERLEIDQVKVEPQGNRAIVKLVFAFTPAPIVNMDKDSKITTIQVSSVPVKGQGLTGKTIVLDPGHAVIQPGGWLDPGALGFKTKLKEKDVNLPIALKLKSLLEAAGAKVVLTHTGSTELSLAQRAEIANNLQADIFVSIHANSSVKAGISGHSTYFYAPYNNEVLFAQRYERQKLATLVQKEMVKMGGRKDIGVLEANFAVLRETRVPSILVETAFLSDPTEETLLAQDWYRQKLAEGIFNGIKAYFN